ncbi:MAG: polysaccharide deacetylase family protein [Acidimicrobiia bacterium]|nr:polysaccharide deacetylase family protein [Acidimicrobiia bacterium]
MSGDRDVTVCLTFDFDAISIWVGPRHSRSPNLIARGEFGEVGANRLVDLLDEHGVPSTWFIPGHTIDTFPEVCARVAGAGHEVGYHGYCHEAPSSKADEADERALLTKAMGRIEGLTGRPPVGHRLPGGNLGERWARLLLEYGFSYDSSMAPNDFAPTYCRLGDVVRTDAAYEFGAEVDLVELPFDWSLDDWPYFSPEPHHDGLRSPNEVFDIWASDFEFVYRKLGTGVFVLTMHPQCIGRGSRLLMLERLIAHMKAHEGVRFRTMAEVAAEFRATRPLVTATATG